MKKEGVCKDEGAGSLYIRGRRECLWTMKEGVSMDKEGRGLYTLGSMKSL